jgi:hypothetical protein
MALLTQLFNPSAHSPSGKIRPPCRAAGSLPAYDDQSRAFVERFFKRTRPNMIQAGTSSATLSSLKAVKAAGTKETEAVAKKLKERPVDDAFAQGKVLANGSMVDDMYLFEVKAPAESKKPWDYYKQIVVIPGDQAFFTIKESGCPLTKRSGSHTNPSGGYSRRNFDELQSIAAKSA